MSTIAWDGRLLAADTMAEFCGRRMRTTKLCRLPDGSLVGAAGMEAVAFQMFDWIAAGEPPERRPAAQADAERSVHLLHVMLDGMVWLHTSAGKVRVLEEFAAVGSGGDYAVAAMACGKDAIGAVEIACRFDARSAPPVEWLRLREDP